MAQAGAGARAGNVPFYVFLVWEEEGAWPSSTVVETMPWGDLIAWEVAELVARAVKTEVIKEWIATREILEVMRSSLFCIRVLIGAEFDSIEMDDYIAQRTAALIPDRLARELRDLGLRISPMVMGCSDIAHLLSYRYVRVDFGSIVMNSDNQVESFYIWRTWQFSNASDGSFDSYQPLNPVDVARDVVFNQGVQGDSFCLAVTGASLRV